jgi:hypothetical protein
MLLFQAFIKIQFNGKVRLKLASRQCIYSKIVIAQSGVIIPGTYGDGWTCAKEEICFWQGRLP